MSSVASGYCEAITRVELSDHIESVNDASHAAVADSHESARIVGVIREPKGEGQGIVLVRTVGYGRVDLAEGDGVEHVGSIVCIACIVCSVDDMGIIGRKVNGRCKR